jgi:glutamate-ammonia-ligase adenylyltransferase
MVRIAWRDLAGISRLEDTMADVSALADGCIEVALDHHHHWLAGRFGLPRDEAGNPVRMVVLGLGKLGGGELNFSSDVDLIYAYDGAGSTDGDRVLDNQEFFIRLGRKLAGSLDRMDAGGFVFRTDLRLRPNGDSGPLVLSFAAMEYYYQTHGRDWERYALIKARVVAGDRDGGAELLEMLRPFVYRKYLDFSAFDAIREMKLLIERQLRSSGNRNDIKLGRGGIREIEFLVQNHQLIRGGRETSLQTQSLYRAMDALVALGVMEASGRDALRQAYRFLRNLEHRLQMVADRQTQKLPETSEERVRIAWSMGFSGLEAFEEALEKHRSTVHGMFGRVLASPETQEDAERDPRLTALWQGQLDPDEARAALVEAGYDEPGELVGMLGRFREGSLYRAYLNVERDRLDRLMPMVLGEAGRHAAAARAVTAFVSVVEAIGRRSVYLSLLIENPVALRQLLHLCAASPWISRHIGLHPVVLDELLQPLEDASRFDREQLRTELSHRISQVEPGDEEMSMNALREFHHGVILRAAAADVRGDLDAPGVERALTLLAEVLLEQVLVDAGERVEKRQGRAPGSAGVVAYGKFAAGELGYHSDLDIVVIFDPDESVAHTQAEYFFSRVGQRLIHLLTTRTHAGALYELDMRLRPSGRSGTLVSSLQAFRDYQLNHAWTWEHQALVRARVVAGGEQLARSFESIRKEVLCLPREKEKLRGEIMEMRRRMLDANCRSDARHYDIKLDHGGIVDIEFLLQYLVLLHAGDRPALCEPRNTLDTIAALEAEGILSAEQVSGLGQAYRTYLGRSLSLKLLDQPVLVPQSELKPERDFVSDLWGATFGAAFG